MCNDRCTPSAKSTSPEHIAPARPKTTLPEYPTAFILTADVRSGGTLIKHSLRNQDPTPLRYALRAAVLAAIDHELEPTAADYLMHKIAAAVQLDEFCAYLSPIIKPDTEPCAQELFKLWDTLQHPDSYTYRRHLISLTRPQLINLVTMFDENREIAKQLSSDISADIVLRLYGAAIVSQPLFLTAAILSLPDHWPLATETEATRDDADDVPLIER